MVDNKSYLLLGEGDFTYSLDVCRYVASLSTKENDEIDAETLLDLPSQFSITCTGVDTLHELRDKYKDIEFILRNIQSCSTKLDGGGGAERGSNISEYDHRHQSNSSQTSKSRSRVDTTILHGINAVEAESKNNNDSSNAIDQSFDHVLFNHPHLGTEDAQLHSKFLQHLFHAASFRWMNPQKGLLHLTLVNGQCARWKCIEGAEKHGLVLLRRREFHAPPPIPSEVGDKTEGQKTYYSLRRHQSGRSFANRRRMQPEPGSTCHSTGQNDSETLVFGRASDYPRKTDASNIGMLPWETASTTNATETQNDANGVEGKSYISFSEAPANDESNPFPCQYCPKPFQEHRSLKNHMMCTHPDCEEVRAWKLEKSKKKNRKRKMKDEAGGDDNIRMQQSNVSNDDSKASTLHSTGAGLRSPTWICTMCKTTREQTATRTFPHKQALLDHQRAKHFGNHLDIKPDWHHGGDNVETSKSDEDANIINPGQGNTPSDGGASATHGSCSICDQPYSTEMDKLRHEMIFLPTSSEIAKTVAQRFMNGDIIQSNNEFKCCHCSKSFRELRAKRQHENFCSLQVG